jgi:hypothetical protein
VRTVLAAPWIVLTMWFGHPQQSVQGEPPQIRSAAAQLEDSLEKARQVYDDSVKKAYRRFNDEVDTAVKEASKKGDAATASRLESAKRLPPGPLSLKPAEVDSVPMIAGRLRLSFRLAGTTWVAEGDEMTFNPDGTVDGKNKKALHWQWVALDAHRILMLYPDGWINHFEFDTDMIQCRLFEYCKPRETSKAWQLSK